MLKSWATGLSRATGSKSKDQREADDSKWKSLSSGEPQSPRGLQNTQSTWSSASPTTPYLANSSKPRSEGAYRDRRHVRGKDRLLKVYSPSADFGKGHAGKRRQQSVSQRTFGPVSAPAPQSAIRFIWPTLMTLKSMGRHEDKSDERSRTDDVLFNNWTNGDPLVLSQKLAMDLQGIMQVDSLVLGVPGSGAPGNFKQRPGPGEAIPSPLSATPQSQVDSGKDSDIELNCSKRDEVCEDARQAADLTGVVSKETEDTTGSGNGSRDVVVECKGSDNGTAPEYSTSSDSQRASAARPVPKMQVSKNTKPPALSKTGSLKTESIVPLSQKISKDQPGGTSPASSTISQNQKDAPKKQASKELTKRQTKELHDMIATYRNMSDDELELMSFTVDQQATIHNYFIMYDADGSGAVSMNELLSVFHAMDRAPKEGSAEMAILDHLMKSLDKSEDGELKFEQFLRLLLAFYSTVYKHAFMDNAVTNETKNGKIRKLPKKNMRLALIQMQQAGFALRHEELQQVIDKGEAILDYSQGSLEDVLEAKSSTYGFTFEQFHKVLKFFRELEFNQLRRSAGFDSERVEFLKGSFADADTDGSGSLDIREVAEQFEKASIPIVDVYEFVDLFARMDVDKSSTLSFQEFLRLMSIYSKSIAAKYDSLSPNSRKSINSLRALNAKRTWRFQDNAKQVLLQAQEVFENSQGAAQMVNRAIVEEVEHQMLAKEYGLSIADVKSIWGSFEFCDNDGSGTINKEELISVLRNLGFPPNTGFQNQVYDSCIENFEEDSDGLVFYRAFKFILKYFTALAHAAFEMFRQGDVIPRDSITLALYQLGQYFVKQTISDFLQEHGLDENADVGFEMFAALLSFLRHNNLERWRRTYGFSSTEIENFRTAASIAGGLEGHSGKLEIALNRVQSILEGLGYLDGALISKQGKTILQALARVDREGTGLNFEDLLLLLRHLENYRVLAKREEEEKAIRESGLKLDEASLLRSLFKNLPKNDEGDVSQQDLKVMLSQNNIAKTQDQRRKLKQVLEEFCKDPEDGVSFAKLVRILRRLEHLTH